MRVCQQESNHVHGQRGRVRQSDHRDGVRRSQAACQDRGRARGRILCQKRAGRRQAGEACERRHENEKGRKEGLQAHIQSIIPWCAWQISALSPAQKICIVGGGYIGMECTAAISTWNKDITVVFPEKHLMQRLFTPEIATHYEKLFTDKGVKFQREVRPGKRLRRELKCTHVIQPCLSSFWFFFGLCLCLMPPPAIPQRDRRRRCRQSHQGRPGLGHRD